MFEGFKKYKELKEKLERAEGLNREYVFELTKYDEELKKLRKENLELRHAGCNKLDVLWEKYLKENY